MRTWLSVAVLGSLLALHNAQRLAPVSLFDELRFRLTTDYVGVGNLFGAYLLAYALFTIPAGMLADRYENRHVIASGVLLSLLAGTAFALTVSYPLALVARLLLGIAGALLYVPVVRHVVASFPQKKRGAVMGCVEMGAGAGMAFSLILLPFLAEHSALETTFLSLSALAALVLAATLVFLPSAPPVPINKSRGTRRALVKNPRFQSLLVFHFLGMLSTYAVLGWLPTFLRNDFGYSAVLAGLVSTLVTVALSVCSPFAGIVSDRLGKRTSVLVAGSFMALV
jgi:MFS family permease